MSLTTVKRRKRVAQSLETKLVVLWRKITAVIHSVTFLRVAAPRKHEKNKHHFQKPSGNQDGNKIVFLDSKNNTIKHNRFLEEANNMAAN